LQERITSNKESFDFDATSLVATDNRLKVLKTLKYLFFANTDWYLFNFRRSLVENIVETGDRVVIVAPVGPHKTELQKTGATVRTIELNRRIGNPFSELKTILELARIYREEKPDLCHHFTIKCILYGSLVARLLGVRAKVNSFTGLGYLFTNSRRVLMLPRRVVLLLLRFLLRGVRSKVIVQNEDDREFLLSHRVVSDDNCVWIPGSGIDMHEFNPSIKKAKPVTECVVLMASRLLIDKGVVEFFEAARIIKETKETSGLRFILAGAIDSGNFSAISEERLEELIAQGNVDYVGQQRDIKHLLSLSDVVVLPSYREGVPRILLEALSCEIPVVGSDVPGIKEIVREGRNGLLVPAGDAGSLSEAIYSLVADPSLREALGRSARESIQSKYDQATIVSQTRKLYEALCVS